MNLSDELKPGTEIRLGTAVNHVHGSEEVRGNTITLREPYFGSTGQLDICKKDHKRVLKMAINAYNNTEVNAVKAESCFLLGKA